MGTRGRRGLNGTRQRLQALSAVLALAVLLALSGCTGQSRHTFTLPDSLARALRFLHAMDISPDTLPLVGEIDLASLPATATRQHRLSVNEAKTLALGHLCGVDGKRRTATLLGVWPVSREVTALLFSIEGDGRHTILATYDTDGIIADMMQPDCASPRGTVVLTPGEGGRFALTHRHRPGMSESVSHWQIDPITGIIARDEPQGDGMNREDGKSLRRTLEEMAWTPLQDDEAVARYEAFLQVRPDAAPLVLTELLDRFDFAPWLTLTWLYEHPGSHADRLFVAGVRERGIAPERLRKGLYTVHDKAVREYWLDRLAL